MRGVNNWEYRWTCGTQAPFACTTFAGSLFFSVRVENPPKHADFVTVDYQIDDITAVHGVNYTGATSGTLTIPANRFDAPIILPILDTGSVDAPNKTVRLRLTGSSVPGADISDTVIGNIKSAGEIPRDCTPSRPDGDSFSTTCTDRPAGYQWQATVTCFIEFPQFVLVQGPVITGNGTSSASCAGTGWPFWSWSFQVVR
jgi:hypothetical protein